MVEHGALQRKAVKKKIYWHMIEKQVFNNAKAIHCINHAEESQISKYSSTETFVLPNGVCTDVYTSKDYRRLEHIGFVGRLHEIKGLDLLIKALPYFPHLKLLVAGCGNEKYEAYLNQLVSDLKLQSKVQFLGFADKKVKSMLFKKSLFIAIPSYNEVLSFVALESLSNSTPVLITKQCNFPEIEEQNAGLVLDNNNTSTIVEGITKLLAKDLQKMSENAFFLAKNRYSIEVIAKNMYKQMNNYIAR